MQPTQEQSNDPEQVINPVVAPEEPKQPKLSKKHLQLIILVIVIAIGGVAFWKLRPGNDTKNSSAPSASNAAVPGTVFCTKVGLDSVQCENLDTKELKKYTLPASLGEVIYMLPSPDGQKFFVSAWTQSATGAAETSQTVFDGKLKSIAPLPIKKDADGQDDIYEYDVKWLNDTKLIYTKRNTDFSTKTTTLYTFDVATKTEKLVATLDANFERIMPVTGKNYIFGLQAYDVPAENATKRKYVVVDLSTKKIKDINKNGVTSDSLAYNLSTSRFYDNILNEAAQTFDVKAYDVSDPTGSPKFVEIQHIKNRYAGGTTAYEAIVTKKGLYVTSGILAKNAPLQFVDTKGVVTDTHLAVGNNGGDILLSLAKFPDFPKADKNDIVISDFYRPADGTPAKIVSFLSAKAMSDSDCKEGNYTTLSDVTYDSDKQFSVMVSNCKTSALVFYVADSDSYKQVAATQEGMSCEERDKLGISAKVLSTCYPPGEGP